MRLFAVVCQCVIVEVVAPLRTEVTHSMLHRCIAHRRALSFVLLHFIVRVKVVLVGKEFEVEEAQITELTFVSTATVVNKVKKS